MGSYRWLRFLAVVVVATAVPAAGSTDRAEWITHASEQILADFPRVDGFMWFNNYKPQVGEPDWRIVPEDPELPEPAVVDAYNAAWQNGRILQRGVFIDGAPADMSRIDYFESYVGHHDRIGWYESLSAPFPADAAQAVLDRGSVPFIMWQLFDASVPGESAYTGPSRLGDIIAGQYDAAIEQWADAAGQIPGPVEIAVGHEMNGNWFTWSYLPDDFNNDPAAITDEDLIGHNGNTPRMFKDAFRRIVGIFRQAGAANVQFVWVVNADFVDDYTIAYPGDDYVDRLGMAGYNAGRRVRDPDDPHWDDWREFEEIFGAWWPGATSTYGTLAGLSDRPIIVAEFATARPPDGDGDGVSDFLDNCLDVVNPEQTDCDADGLGDACDLDAWRCYPPFPIAWQAEANAAFTQVVFAFDTAGRLVSEEFRTQEDYERITGHSVDIWNGLLPAGEETVWIAYTNPAGVQSGIYVTPGGEGMSFDPGTRGVSWRDRMTMRATTSEPVTETRLTYDITVTGTLATDGWSIEWTGIAGTVTSVLADGTIKVDPVSEGDWISGMRWVRVDCTQDIDGDGVCDCLDGCPADPDKTSPGVCGCGVAEGTCSGSGGGGGGGVVDQCPDDPEKTEPGICGCGVADMDTDGDGRVDCEDGCPEDADKVEPGICGCGEDDRLDADGDGIADCIDECPDDEGKADAGACGCGVPDTDSDGDGMADCVDSCPEDANKTWPGECGCGEPDVPGCGRAKLIIEIVGPGSLAGTDVGQSIPVEIGVPIEVPKGTRLRFEAMPIEECDLFVRWVGYIGGLPFESTEAVLDIELAEDAQLTAEFVDGQWVSGPCGAGVCQAMGVGLLGMALMRRRIGSAR